jgi:TolB protein
MRKLLIASLALISGSSLNAQDTTRVPVGVRLEAVYTVGKRPLIAVRPVSATPDQAQAGQQISSILERDLDYSDRFEIAPTPSALAAGTVDYGQWNSLRVIYVIASDLMATGSGYELTVTAHDVPYTKTKESRAFSLPQASSPGFRMAVHAVSDEIVRWLTDRPGAAASRIAVARNTPRGSELLLIDSDGENVQRVLSSQHWIYSPALSPDGRKIAYSQRLPSGKIELRERDLTTNSDRVISNRSVIAFTPAYSPDGKHLAFSFAIGNGTEIHEFDLERGGTPRRLTNTQHTDGAPTYSPDGSRIAFHSNRFGNNHVFMSSTSGGGNPVALSPIGVGRVKFTAPDWSPTGDEIVISGESKGGFHLMILNAARPQSATQITETGINEDPTWAPDGRHIAYTGVGREGAGLYVIDKTTGRTRRVLAGDFLKMAEWSGRLAGATSAGN